MNVAIASATCKTAYNSSEETKSVKDYSRNEYVQVFNDCDPMIQTDLLFPGHLHEQHGHIVAEPASETFL